MHGAERRGLFTPVIVGSLEIAVELRRIQLVNHIVACAVRVAWRGSRAALRVSQGRGSEEKSCGESADMTVHNVCPLVTSPSETGLPRCQT